jgi:hypothetical protein
VPCRTALRPSWTTRPAVAGPGDARPTSPACRPGCPRHGALNYPPAVGLDRTGTQRGRSERPSRGRPAPADRAGSRSRHPGPLPVAHGDAAVPTSGLCGTKVRVTSTTAAGCEDLTTTTCQTPGPPTAWSSETVQVACGPVVRHSGPWRSVRMPSRVPCPVSTKTRRSVSAGARTVTVRPLVNGSWKRACSGGQRRRCLGCLARSAGQTMRDDRRGRAGPLRR